MANTALTFVVTIFGNSYISLLDAEDYFDMNVLFPEPWTSTLDNDTKTKALVAATRKIDSQMLIGRKADPEQPLEFPRALYSDSRDYLGHTVEQRLVGTYGLYNLPGWVAEEEVQQCVLDATCEEALALIKHGASGNKRAELQRQGVTSYTLGPLSESFNGSGASGNKLLSVTATQLLARYLGGGRTIV